jgi:hypothetical protein
LDRLLEDLIAGRLEQLPALTRELNLARAARVIE